MPTPFENPYSQHLHAASEWQQGQLWLDQSHARYCADESGSSHAEQHHPFAPRPYTDHGEAFEGCSSIHNDTHSANFDSYSSRLSPVNLCADLKYSAHSNGLSETFMATVPSIARMRQSPAASMSPASSSYSDSRTVSLAGSHGFPYTPPSSYGTMVPDALGSAKFHEYIGDYEPSASSYQFHDDSGIALGEMHSGYTKEAMAHVEYPNAYLKLEDVAFIKGQPHGLDSPSHPFDMTTDGQEVEEGDSLGQGQRELSLQRQCRSPSAVSAGSDSEYTPGQQRRKDRTGPLNPKLGRPRTTKAAPSGKISKRRRKQTSLSASAGLKKGCVNEASSAVPSTEKKIFSCPLSPYGCKTSFPSKNEWKRHFLSQHQNLGFWRCDLCATRGATPNDFGRKDLFTQHLRRMHWQELGGGVASSPASSRRGNTSHPTSHPGCQTEDRGPLASRRLAVAAPASPDASSYGADRSASIPPTSPAEQEVDEEVLAVARERCWVKLRDPPRVAACPFCNKRFSDTESPADGSESSRALGATPKTSGVSPSEVWLEHVGKHLLDAAKSGNACAKNMPWAQDTVLRDWLRQERLIEQAPAHSSRGQDINGAAGPLWKMISQKSAVEQRNAAVQHKRTMASAAED